MQLLMQKVPGDSSVLNLIQNQHEKKGGGTFLFTPKSPGMKERADNLQRVLVTKTDGAYVDIQCSKT